MLGLDGPGRFGIDSGNLTRDKQDMRPLTTAALAFLLACLLASCHQAPRSVTVGVDNSPPFYIFQQDGTVRGLAVEVLSEAARRSHIQLRWVLLTDTPLDDALTSRTVQMWPAVGPTPERKSKFYLSEAWLESDYVLLSPLEKPVRTAREAAGLTIAHARLRMTASLAKRYLPASQLVVVLDRAEAVQQVCLGRAAAALIESRMVEALLLNRPRGCAMALNISYIPGATTPLSIAAVPEAAGLAQELRSEISKMAVDGEFGTILEKWAPFSAEVARSIGLERAQAVRNRYLTFIAAGLLVCAMLLGFVAHRAYQHRRFALTAEEEMRSLASQDSLTGLANRSLFTERLTRCLQPRRDGSQPIFAVLFLDLDHFKVINDSLGHMVGDKLLLGIAQRLKKTVRATDVVGRLEESDTVARLGGDEFAVLVENIQSAENAQRLADRILRDMSLPFLLENRSVFTTFSIGVALSNGSHQSAEEILRDADIAMYAAKTSGKARFALCDPAMRARAIARLEIETDLRRALTSQELFIHYQPEVDLRTGEIIGFEALVRWLHPKRGLIAPLDFVPIAEETGLIAPLGAWVLTEACSQMRKWQLAFPAFSKIRISVNLSGKQLNGKDLLRDVDRALQLSSLPPQCLDLEITESILMDDTESANQTLRNLKSLGVGLQIDDFGTGYSSLSYLHRLPFDTLKIDRVFVHSMDDQADGIVIVRTIMALARNLKMTVIAEGVETQAQWSHLREMGCEFGQGYHFAAPMDAVSVEQLLRERSRTGENFRQVVLAS